MKISAFWSDFESLINPNRIQMKDVNRVKQTIQNMIADGRKSLQIVTDYDRTITKQHVNGVNNISSFEIINLLPTMSTEYVKESRALCAKYYPIETDPTIDLETKKKSMVEWWSRSIDLLRYFFVLETNFTLRSKYLKNRVGNKIFRKTDVEEIVRKVGVGLRDKLDVLFGSLHKAQVPILVFSAGIGDTIDAVLHINNIFYSNVKIVSNFLKLNENSEIEGYKDEIIHVFNKNEFALHSHHCIESIRDRDNIILMGDSLGDANMADGVPRCKNILKIGFFFSTDESKYEILLDQYLKFFDIVLIDDQTMEIPNLIIDHILNV